jgi:molybdopterin molybdotransferase
MRSPLEPMKTIAEIAAELHSHDPQALSANDVNAFLERLVEPVTATEPVSIFQALGRVLASDVVSPVSVPPHDNSAMDGYAFAGAHRVAGQPMTLRVVGTALAGKAWTGTAARGECVKIMTGAILPPGLDTVVPQELAQVDGELVTLAADTRLPVGANRRLKGEDLMQGGIALAQGEPLTAAALGLLASLGLETVTAFRRLRVACLSTGDELMNPGDPPREGAVYDSNRLAMLGMLSRLGVEVIDLGVVRDDPALLEAALRNAARQADAIVTSGGVSAGDADHTRAMIGKLGDVAFWRIAMRPGRPMAVGRICGDAAAKLQAKLASSAYPANASSYQNDTDMPKQSRGGNGDLSGLCAPRPAAHDGHHAPRSAVAACRGRRAPAQEAGADRIPAGHPVLRSRRRTAGAQHRAAGLGHAQLNGAGQLPHRSAACTGRCDRRHGSGGAPA